MLEGPLGACTAVPAVSSVLSLGDCDHVAVVPSGAGLSPESTATFAYPVTHPSWQVGVGCERVHLHGHTHVFHSLLGIGCRVMGLDCPLQVGSDLSSWLSFGDVPGRPTRGVGL